MPQDDLLAYLRDNEVEQIIVIANRGPGEHPAKELFVLDGGIQADLRVVSDAEFPFALAYFTGSKEHNIQMRSRALSHGWTLNE